MQNHNPTTKEPPASNPSFIIRLGYVGAGFLAQHVHLPNFSSLSGCQLAALAERRPDLATRVAERFGISKVYADHSQLAQDPDIDAVAVSADYAGQGEIATDLLQAGKPVFMEKPMAVSLRQGERILEAERKGKARLMVGYMKRFDPGNRLVRDLVRAWRDDPSKGKLLYVRSHSFCGNWIAGLDTSGFIRSNEPLIPTPIDELLPPWLPKEFQKGYIAYLQQYTHQVNLFRFLLDARDREDVQVESVALDEDGYTGIIILKVRGTRCAIESASTRFHGWDEHTQVFFEGGWIRSAPALLFFRPSFNEIEVYEAGEQGGYRYPSAPVSQSWHYQEEAKHFLRCLRDGTEFDSPGKDSLIDVGVFEAIYQQFIRRRKEEPNEILF
jgi:predicted dehydrogenase